MHDNGVLFTPNGNELFFCLFLGAKEQLPKVSYSTSGPKFIFVGSKPHLRELLYAPKLFNISLVVKHSFFFCFHNTHVIQFRMCLSRLIFLLLFLTQEVVSNSIFKMILIEKIVYLFMYKNWEPLAIKLSQLKL